MPNVGKSTLFNALLQKQAALVADYPFTTVKSNEGIIPVPDADIEAVAKIVGVKQFKPATITFIDIAGLVKGAHQGEGLGNQFLGYIRETKVLCFVIRFFKDKTVSHVLDQINPQQELAILEQELILADLATLGKQKALKPNASKQERASWSLVEKLKKELNQGKAIRDLVLSPEEKDLLKPLNLITVKPVIFLANLSENQLKQSRELLKDFPKQPVVPISAKLEMELIDLSRSEQKELLKSVGLAQSALESLIQTAYQTLNLISFYTIKNKDVRTWTLRRGENAFRASALIHTDMMKNFIKAEVVSTKDFLKHQGWQNCLTQGIIRTEGKDYTVQDQDIIEFKINS